MKTSAQPTQRDDPNMRILTIRTRPEPPTVESIMAHLGVDRTRAEEIYGDIRETLPQKVGAFVSAYLEGSSSESGIEPPGPGCQAVSEVYLGICSGGGMCVCQRFECEGGPDVEVCIPLETQRSS